MRRRLNQQGIALVVVLWVALILAAISGAFVLETRSAAQIARNVVDQSAARALADGFIDYVAFGLMKPQSDRAWRRDGTIYDVALDDGAVRFLIEDENGKINVNRAPRALLEGLFLAAGAPDQQASTLADAIMAWREKAPEREGGQGTNLGQAGLPNRRRFRLVDEVQGVDGMPRRLFERVRPALTVHSTGNGVHPPTASRLALRAIPGISAEAVDTYLLSRTTDDDVAAMNTFLGEGDARTYYLARSGGRITVVTQARTTAGAIFVREAIVALGGNSSVPIKIFEWRTGSAAEFERRAPTAGTTPE